VPVKTRTLRINLKTITILFIIKECVKKTISLVSHYFKEEENIEVLYRQVDTIMSCMKGYDFKFILTDNPSTASTVQKIKSIATGDNRLKLIVNSRNFGHMHSQFHSIHQSRGDACIIIASDLQYPQEMIPQLVTNWESDAYIVVAVKKESRESRLMFSIRTLYYGLLKNIFDVNIIRNYTDFCLYDRRIINILRNFSESYPLCRGLIAEVVFMVKTEHYSQLRRARGITKNNYYTLYAIGILCIISNLKKYLCVMLRLSTSYFHYCAFCSGAYIVSASTCSGTIFQAGVAPLPIGYYFSAFLDEYVHPMNTQALPALRVKKSERIHY
jgi:hypothetical protein